MDDILARLARRDAFPNLRAIVLAGHSGGGQFVSRYQMSNQVHDALKLPLAYIVANPSSYAYLDAVRPTPSAVTAVSALAPGYVPAPPAKPAPAFGTFGDANNCTTCDNWPYGLQKRVGYTARLTDQRLKAQLAARPATTRAACSPTNAFPPAARRRGARPGGLAVPPTRPASAFDVFQGRRNDLRARSLDDAARHASVAALQ